MGDNGGVRALFRSTTVRIGAVLLVLSLVLALGIVVRNAMRYREAVALDEAGDEDADRVRSERASRVASVRRLLEAVATAEAASKAAR